jgi:chloramphenicol 3-O-phosphotransferase
MAAVVCGCSSTVCSRSMLVGFPCLPISRRLILLNGASSSGKTTLAKALQNQLTTPHVYFGEADQSAFERLLTTA